MRKREREKERKRERQRERKRERERERESEKGGGGCRRVVKESCWGKKISCSRLLSHFSADYPR